MALSTPSDKTVLVTGASGFVASYIIRALLEAGYNVRGSLRSNSAIPKIRAAQGDLASRLSFAIVPDMSAPHAFDEAVKGVSGIIHTASPFILTPRDVEADLLKPAIRGTESILESAATAGPQLSRVVITASFASIFDMSLGYRPGYVYTEKEWNPATYSEAAGSSDGGFSYCASKALAEKAGWDWVAEHKPSYAVTTICPPWIFGPALSTITNLDHLNESTETIWNLINGSKSEVPPVDFAGFANVTDVASAHLLAFESEAAAGERFLVGSHFDYQTAVDIIRDEFPSLKDRVPAGKPGSANLADWYTPDGSKAEKILGLKYTSLRDTLIDTVKDLLEAEKRTGWTKK